MCLIVFAYQMHQKYKLIVAANRDEFYQRGTAPIHYWEDHPQIVAGRDLEKKGTWMGVTDTGRFAALTNYRGTTNNAERSSEGGSAEAINPEPIRSRGELVANFLKSNIDPKQYMNQLIGQANSNGKTKKTYLGYNLLAGSMNELYYHSNIENKAKKLAPGIYGLSNDLLDSDWPKVNRGKEGLLKIVEENKLAIEGTEVIFKLLQESDQATDTLLPQTGVSLEWERILSSMFIKSEGYGTRSSTALLMSDHEIYIKERTFANEQHIDREFMMN